MYYSQIINDQTTRNQEVFGIGEKLSCVLIHNYSQTSLQWRYVLSTTTISITLTFFKDINWTEQPRPSSSTKILRMRAPVKWYVPDQLFWTSLIFLGGRSGIIWILIFMIPVVFASMIHDSYENVLPVSWFTKNFDHPIDLMIFSVAT